MRLKTGLIFSGETETVNQILPHKNKWAWDLFLKGQANNWSPAEIPMQKDIEQWKSKDCLSENEKLLVKRCLGFFAGSESLVSNNLLMSIFKVVSDAECRQYILRQAFEESLHNQTIVYICDSLNLDIDEVYEAYKNIPSIKAKDDFLMKITSDMSRNDFKIIPLPVPPEPFFESDNEQELNYYLKDLENYKVNKNKTLVSYKEALKNIISYYIICEGIFFFSGFAMLLSFGRQNKLPGICEQIQYTLRDESLHIEFGTKLINTIIEQNSDIWTDKFKNELQLDTTIAVNLEIDYAKDTLPEGILGLNSSMFIDYVQYIANRRLSGIGLTPFYKNARNPFSWMTETIDLYKNKNFFERKVTEYGAGTLKDDF